MCVPVCIIAVCGYLEICDCVSAFLCADVFSIVFLPVCMCVLHVKVCLLTFACSPISVCVPGFIIGVCTSLSC